MHEGVHSDISGLKNTLTKVMVGCLQTGLLCILIKIWKPTGWQTFQMIVKHVPTCTNKNFLYLHNNQLRCLSLSWCKFVIDLVMFVIDLGYVCHWLYTGKKKNLSPKLSKSLSSIWFVADLSEHQLDIY